MTLTRSVGLYPHPSHETRRSAEWSSSSLSAAVWAHQSHGTSPTGRQTHRRGHDHDTSAAPITSRPWRRWWWRWCLRAEPSEARSVSSSSSSTATSLDSVFVPQPNIASRLCIVTVYTVAHDIPARPKHRCHLRTISAQKTIKTASVSRIVSWPSLIINCFICVVLVVAACYLGHLKKFLIDWLIDWFLIDRCNKE